MDELLFFGAMLVFAFGLVSKLAHKSPITAPMVFVGVGILASPLGLNLFEVKINSEAEGQQLCLFVFLIFGMVLVPAVTRYRDGKALLYAILSLTVIRMLSVIVLTVLISVFIHGLSALPLSGLYGRFAGKGNEKTG